jgi:SulP family sulfate permease
MAYAAIAGVPVEYGLYSVPLALVGYVVFGGCGQLFVGPSATVASISAVSVAAALPGSAPAGRFVALTALLAFMVGAVYVLLGLLRMRSSSGSRSRSPSRRGTARASATASTRARR